MVASPWYIVPQCPTFTVYVCQGDILQNTVDLGLYYDNVS